MNAELQRLIAQGGNAYIRNLVAAEEAVRRGEFGAAKVLRAAAYVHRSLAMRLARLEAGEANASDVLRASVAELGELDAALRAAAPPAQGGPVWEQIGLCRARMETLLRDAANCLADHSDVLDSRVATILRVCLVCGFTSEESAPELCPVCGAVGADFAWFGPFYVENAERLGWLSPAQIIATMEATPRTLADLTDGVSDAALTARPSEEQWCAKEILGHLVEIDRLFAKRVAAVLRREGVPDLTAPGPPWQMHEGKGYEGWPLVQLLGQFGEARATSLALVRDLTPPEWSRHGTLGDSNTSVSDLGIWLANHDLGHAAQIRRLCAPPG